jgi:hypothetical protein
VKKRNDPGRGRQRTEGLLLKTKLDPQNSVFQQRPGKSRREKSRKMLVESVSAIYDLFPGSADTLEWVKSSLCCGRINA